MSASRAIPIRMSSLFLISKPSFRQAFLTFASTAYSDSGMVKLSRTSWGLVSLSAFVAVTFFAALAGVFLAAGFALVAAERFAAGLVFEFILEVSLKLTVVYFTTVPKKRYKSFIRYDGIHSKSKEVDNLLSLSNSSEYGF